MIYLLSPYTHPNECVLFQRFKAACQAVATLKTMGVEAFSPIVHNHPIQRYLLKGTPCDYQACRSWSDQFLRWCSGGVVLCIDGWEESVGIKSEIEILRQMDKHACYMPGPDVPEVHYLPDFSGRFLLSTKKQWTETSLAEIKSKRAEIREQIGMKCQDTSAR